VAHDLMNPVSTTLLVAKSIERAELDRKQLLFFLQGITDNMRKMSRIIDDLLMLSEVRKIDIVSEPIDMGKTVAAAVERLKDMIVSSQTEIIQPESWPEALGYAPWVEEVWVNYISNAIKYGGKPPCIELSACIQPGGAVKFCVRDNGKGLSGVDKELLFKPFSKLKQTHALGHGLGLSIVRRIVEKLDGEVSLESAPGGGSIFGFTLPASLAQISAED
jgi:two-component system sensor histidine kinase/response regulator